MSLTTIITDEAHGLDVPGKHSPDGNFHEWEYSRKMCRALRKELDKYDINNYSNVPEDREPGLRERVRRANSIQSRGAKVLLSLHNNAATDKNVWSRASGVEVYTDYRDNESDKMAEIFMQHLKIDFPFVTQRTDYWSDGDVDKEARFTVIAGIKENNKWVIKPNYYGLLIETLFMDNKKDLQMLQDEEFFNKYVEMLTRVCLDICSYLGDQNIIKTVNVKP